MDTAKKDVDEMAEILETFKFIISAFTTQEKVNEEFLLLIKELNKRLERLELRYEQ